ncbi:MAG: hypothetical protein NWP69_04355, partial [Congregibacter sp.]|nr:hypothetical protein [Congregibacter sp.]
MQRLLDAYVRHFVSLVGWDEVLGIRSGGGLYREAALVSEAIQNDYQLLSAHLAQNSQAKLEALNRQLWSSTMVLFLFAALLSILLSRTLTNPLNKLSLRIRAFMMGNFVREVPTEDLISGGDEVGQIARDFSELQKHTLNSIQQLTQERITAEQASRSKSLFLANMSHELRTPLNGVIGMAQLLSTTRLNEEQASFTDTIMHASNSLLVIVSDILDFSKIEAGKAELEHRDFDLISTLHHTVEAFAPEAKQFIVFLGASTAFFAATVGLVQTDIKRVIAYSTCSQLGYMFFAAGVGAYG